MKARKAQVSSIDIIISVIAIMLFISIIIIYFSTISARNDNNKIYRTAILELSPILQEYKVDEIMVNSLQAKSEDEVRNALLSPVGLDDSQFDVCVVIRNSNNLLLLLDGGFMLPEACSNLNNLCPNHNTVNSYIKPVLYDGMIYELNMVVCEP